MQYMDFCCKKNNEITHRVEDKNRVISSIR